jgi:hypothetical protein
MWSITSPATHLLFGGICAQCSLFSGEKNNFSSPRYPQRFFDRLKVQASRKAQICP